MEFIIVTGLSGAGKSHAVRCLEDLGYYAIDNMPPQLIREFVGLVKKTTGCIETVAFVADIRGGKFFDDLKGSLDYLETEGIEYKIIFWKPRRGADPQIQEIAGPSAGLTGMSGRPSPRSGTAQKSGTAFVIDTSTMKVAAFHRSSGCFCRIRRRQL